MSIEDALQFFNKLKLKEMEKHIAERLTMEISNRLTFSQCRAFVPYTFTTFKQPIGWGIAKD